MATSARSIPIREALRNLFPARWLRRTARETGTVKRERKTDVVTLFWTMVLGFVDGRHRSIAGLRRAYNTEARESINASSFYKRLTPAFAEMLRQAVVRGLDEQEPRGDLGEIFHGFRDLLVIDSSVMKLDSRLESEFAGCRTTTAPAAAKLHTVHAVRGLGPSMVALTAEREPDIKQLQEGQSLEVGPWVDGQLLLFDKAYFGYELFARIDGCGGTFVVPAKRHVNLEILQVHQGGPRRWVGLHLQEILAERRGSFDVQVSMPTRKMPSGRWSSRDHVSMRVVAVWDPTARAYRVLMTNADPAQMSMKEVPRAYALRWYVETVFKELKTMYRMADLPSANPHIVEALVYASVLTLIVSRRLVDHVRQRWGQLARRVRDHRWARVFASVSRDLLRLTTHPPREIRYLEKALSKAIVHEALDPNAVRTGMLEPSPPPPDTRLKPLGIQA